MPCLGGNRASLRPKPSKKMKRTGFSLVEALAVLGVTAVLFILSGPAALAVRTRADRAAIAADLAPDSRAIVRVGLAVRAAARADRVRLPRSIPMN